MENTAKRKPEILCTYCNKTFSSNSSRNRHIKCIHKAIIPKTNKKHFMCPLCKERSFEAYKILLNHFSQDHQFNIIEKVLEFKKIEEFENWYNNQNMEVNYAVIRNVNTPNYKEIYYICNRSNYAGEYKRKSKQNKRKLKTGGSIRIQGTCPSRIIIRFYKNNSVTVNSIKTHVGHKKEIRAHHLSKTEKLIIADKLKKGIPAATILQDARNASKNQLTRISLLNMKDISNIAKKFNIDRNKHYDDKLVTTMKVKEWNNNGNQSPFLYKEQGYVNCTMENEKSKNKEYREELDISIKEHSIKKEMCDTIDIGTLKKRAAVMAFDIINSTNNVNDLLKFINKMKEYLNETRNEKLTTETTKWYVF